MRGSTIKTVLWSIWLPLPPNRMFNWCCENELNFAQYCARARNFIAIKGSKAFSVLIIYYSFPTEYNLVATFDKETTCTCQFRPNLMFIQRKHVFCQIFVPFPKEMEENITQFIWVICIAFRSNCWIWINVRIDWPFFHWNKNKKKAACRWFSWLISCRLIISNVKVLHWCWWICLFLWKS